MSIFMMFILFAFSLGEKVAFLEKYTNSDLDRISPFEEFFSSKKKRFLMINVMPKKCDACIYEAHIVDMFLKRHKDVMGYGILIGYSMSELKKLEKDFSGLKLLIDASDLKSSKIIKEFSIKKYPSVLVFNKDGIFLYKGSLKGISYPKLLSMERFYSNPSKGDKGVKKFKSFKQLIIHQREEKMRLREKCKKMFEELRKKHQRERREYLKYIKSLKKKK